MQRRAAPKQLTRTILTLPKRKPSAHKGDFGRVLVVAGSSDYVGAAALAAHAALAVLKTGVDLVTVAAPEHVALTLNAISPTLITVKLAGSYLRLVHLRRILPLAQKANVLLIGPGLGRKSDAVIRKLCMLNCWKVIDADAIKALRGKWYRKVRRAIFTPHAMEFSLMTGERLPSDVKGRVCLLQQHASGNTVLLKGHTDIIVSGSKVAYNTTGNATMTKGGTGDVLAGFCAGFLARTGDPFRAACMAAYLNGTIGDSLAAQYGSTYRTEDIIANVHKVWRIP